MRLYRNEDGRRRFEWQGDRLIQRSVLDPDREWVLSLVKDSVNPAHREYNEKAARAKLMGKDVRAQAWGPNIAYEDLAHSDEEIECFTCHTAWITGCAGCHLPVEANWKTERHHYEGGVARNYATYNPQVARDDMFMIGKRGPVSDGKIAPVRSSSALVLSSTNANRERIYVQEPPVSASGYSSQAMNPHFPHTVRKTETKTCSSCHLTENGGNNAMMAQLLLLGTNFVNFVGFNAWAGLEDAVLAAQVTEWDEPQAVIGSYLLCARLGFGSLFQVAFQVLVFNHFYLDALFWAFREPPVRARLAQVLRLNAIAASTSQRMKESVEQELARAGTANFRCWLQLPCLSGPMPRITIAARRGTTSTSSRR